MHRFFEPARAIQHTRGPISLETQATSPLKAFALLPTIMGTGVIWTVLFKRCVSTSGSQIVSDGVSTWEPQQARAVVQSAFHFNSATAQTPTPTNACNPGQASVYYGKGAAGRLRTDYVKNLGRLRKDSAAIRWQDSCETGEELLEIGKACWELWELRQGLGNCRPGTPGPGNCREIAGARQLPGTAARLQQGAWNHKRECRSFAGRCRELQQKHGKTTYRRDSRHLPVIAGNCGKGSLRNALPGAAGKRGNGCFPLSHPQHPLWGKGVFSGVRGAGPTFSASPAASLASTVGERRVFRGALYTPFNERGAGPTSSASPAASLASNVRERRVFEGRSSSAASPAASSASLSVRASSLNVSCQECFLIISSASPARVTDLLCFQALARVG